jgi:hypothetical protein
MAVLLQDVDLAYIDPPLGSESHIFMLESFTVSVGVRSSFPVQLLRPQLWTNATHKQNPDGKWHALGKFSSFIGANSHLIYAEMNFIKKDDHGNAHFQISFLATSHGNFEFTVRISLRKQGMQHSRSKSNNNLVSLGNGSAPQEEIEWKWASGYGLNGILKVSPPNDNMPWTKGPQITEGKKKTLVILHFLTQYPNLISFSWTIYWKLYCCLSGSRIRI